jgi:hypothetical protein
VELCSVTMGFSGDSPSAAAMKIAIALPRISASGNSRPRNMNGISYKMTPLIRTRIPVSKVMRHTEGNSVAYVLRGHALITEISATRAAVCSVVSIAVFDEKEKVG